MSRALVLASSSPSRLRVLRDGGIDPEVVVSGVVEDTAGSDPVSSVLGLAERKASAVARWLPGALVLGCDSMLELDGDALGKPASPLDALENWRRMCGRDATLHTGHCLLDGASGKRISEAASTLVRFGRPSEKELAAYVGSGEPLQTAGGFTIEGRGSAFVEAVDGDVTNVLGLSMPLLRRMLAGLGLELTDFWRNPG